MRDLSAFLHSNAAQVENVMFSASARFMGQDGVPMVWELRCVSSTEDEELRRSAAKRSDRGRGQSASETDVSLYLGRLAARCTVFPDLNDKSLQDSYSVMGADHLLRAMLTPGEYAEYLRQVQKICGFDVPFDDLVEEAKN
ncbi:MAG: phage portal protein [Oscillospiraceae bacterium]|nr:phage portal protein [Oscillospiraceae bacterium]